MPSDGTGAASPARVAAINPMQWDGFSDVGSEKWQTMVAALSEIGYAAIALVSQDADGATREVELLAAHGLVPAPGYWEAPLRSEGGCEQELASAQQAIDAHAAAGLDAIFVAAGMEPDREAAPDRFHDATIDPMRLRWAADLFDRIGAYGADRGVRVCVHQHVGSAIQSASELEAVLAATSPQQVLLGPDTGHLAWAGIDPAEMIRRHHDRIGVAHVKDVRRERIERGAAEGWTYWEAERGGAWAPLGAGSLDLARSTDALPDSLQWLIVEVDHDPDSTPAESSTVSARWIEENWLA